MRRNAAKATILFLAVLLLSTSVYADSKDEMYAETAVISTNNSDVATKKFCGDIRMFMDIIWYIYGKNN